MSTKSETHYIRVRHRIPYSGKGFDALVDAIKAIGKAHPYVQKIGPLEVGKPYISIEEMIPEEGSDKHLPTSVHSIARRCRMEEVVIDSTKTSFNILYEMFNIIQEEGLFPGYFLIGDKALFQKWLSIRISALKMSLFGVPVIIQPELPEDVFLLCGADSKDPEPDDVKFSLKVTLP